MVNNNYLEKINKAASFIIQKLGIYVNGGEKVGIFNFVSYFIFKLNHLLVSGDILINYNNVIKPPIYFIENNEEEFQSWRNFIFYYLYYIMANVSFYSWGIYRTLLNKNSYNYYWAIPTWKDSLFKRNIMSEWRVFLDKTIESGAASPIKFLFKKDVLSWSIFYLMTMKEINTFNISDENDLLYNFGLKNEIYPNFVNAFNSIPTFKIDNDSLITEVVNFYLSDLSLRQFAKKFKDESNIDLNFKIGSFTRPLDINVKYYIDTSIYSISISLREEIFPPCLKSYLKTKGVL